MGECSISFSDPWKPGPPLLLFLLLSGFLSSPIAPAGNEEGGGGLWPPPRTDVPADGGLSLRHGEELVIGLADLEDPACRGIAEALAREAGGAWKRPVRVEALDPGKAQIAAGTREQLRYYLEWYGLEEEARDLPPEGYILYVTEEAVLVAGGGPSGVGWGLQALRALFRRAAAEGWETLPGRKIVDRPAAELRAPVFLLTGKHVPRLEALNRMVDRLSLFRFNGLFLVFSLPCIKEGTESGGGGFLPPYTPGEMKSLAAFGARRGVRIMGGCRLLSPPPPAEGGGGGLLAPWKTLFSSLDGTFFYGEGSGPGERPSPATVQDLAPGGATILFSTGSSVEGDPSLRILHRNPEDPGSGPVISVDLDPAPPPLATRYLQGLETAMGMPGAEKERGLVFRIQAGDPLCLEGRAWLDLLYGGGCVWCGAVDRVSAFQEEVTSLLFGTLGPEGGKPLAPLFRALEVPDYGWDPRRGLFLPPRAVVPGRRIPFLKRSARLRAAAERLLSNLSAIEAGARFDQDLLEELALEGRILSTAASKREAMDRATAAFRAGRFPEAVREVEGLCDRVEALRHLHDRLKGRVCRSYVAGERGVDPWFDLVHRLREIALSMERRRIAAAYGRPPASREGGDSFFRAWGEAGDRVAEVAFPDPDAVPAPGEGWALLDFMDRAFMEVSLPSPGDSGETVPVEWTLPLPVADRVIPGSGALFVPEGGDAGDSRPAQIVPGPEGERRVFLFLAPGDRGYLYFNGPALPERFRCDTTRADRIVVENGAMTVALAARTGRILEWRISSGTGDREMALADGGHGEEGEEDAGGWEEPSAGHAVLSAEGPLLARIEVPGPGAGWSRVDIPWGKPWMEFFRDPGVQGFSLSLTAGMVKGRMPGTGVPVEASSAILEGKGARGVVLLLTPGLPCRHVLEDAVDGMRLRCTSPEALAHVVLAGGLLPGGEEGRGLRLCRRLDTGIAARVRLGPVERRP